MLARFDPAVPARYAAYAKQRAVVFWIVSVVPAALIALGASLFTPRLWGVATIPVILFFLVCVMVGFIYLKLAKKNEAMAEWNGILAILEPEGLAFGPVPSLPWDEVLWIGMADVRAQRAAARATRGLNGARHRTWAKSGHGSLVLSVVYKDADRLLPQLPDTARKMAVKGGKHRTLGTVPFMVVLHPDVLLDSAATETLVAQLRAQASAHGIPFVVSDTEAANTRAATSQALVA